MSPVETRRLGDLVRAATPLDDTGHSARCDCFDCALVWTHGSGLAHARAQVVAAMPGLIERLVAAEREVSRLRARLADTATSFNDTTPDSG